MPQNSKTKLILIIVFITALAFLFTMYFFIGPSRERQEIKEKDMPSAKEEAALPRHNCAVGVFTQTVKRGEEKTFAVSFEPSYPESNYRLKLGNMPVDVSARIDVDTGQGWGTANITVSVSPTAQPASYSLVLIYEEENEQGKYIPNSCQYNLIIK